MRRSVVCVVLYACLRVSVAEAQEPSPWQFMHDGAVFGVFIIAVIFLLPNGARQLAYYCYAQLKKLAR